MKNEKTTIDWLNEAKEQGYEWADSAIENAKKESYNNIPDADLSLSDALLGAFRFFDSKEGFDYWNNIRENLQSKGL